MDAFLAPLLELRDEDFVGHVSDIVKGIIIPRERHVLEDRHRHPCADLENKI